MIPSWAEIRRRIGGRHAISLPVFLLGSPFWIFGWLFNEPATYESLQSGALMLILSFAGQVAMGLVLWLAHLSLARNRQTTPLPLVLLSLVWSASAIARMVVLIVGMEMLGLENPVPTTTRVATAVMMATIGYALGSWGMDAFDRFSAERAAILQKLLSEEGQLTRHRNAIEGMTEALVAQVDQTIQESHEESIRALSRLEDALESAQATTPALEDLRRLSDATWQRISQDLWVHAPAKPPRIRVAEILPLWAKSQPFSPPLLALLGVFLYLLIYARVFDPVVGAIVSVSWLGLAVVFSVASNWMLERAGRAAGGLALVLGAVLALSSIPLLGMFSILGVTTEWNQRAIIVHFISVAMLLASSLPPAVARARAMVLDNLRSQLDSRTLEKLHVESQLAVVSQKIANHLHGDVRGNFLAAVLNLQAHLDSGSLDKARTTIATIKDLLGQSVITSAAALRESESLEAFIGNWSGIVDIRMDRPLSRVPDEYHAAVHTIVVDAVNNAIRHGGADWIRIDTTIEPSALVLNIRNNGRTGSSDRQGIGTANLNLFAPDSWTRIPQGDGITQLLVRLDSERLRSPLSSR